MEIQTQENSDTVDTSRPMTRAQTIEDVSKLSLEDLKSMCNSTSDELYDELVNKSDQVAGLEAERELLMASVKSLAEFNLSRQSDYEMDRSQLLTLISESNKIREEVDLKANKLNEISQQKSLHTILGILSDAMVKADEESEKIAQKFLNNDLQYEMFVNEFVAKRKIFYLRRIKLERANSLVRS